MGLRGLISAVMKVAFRVDSSAEIGSGHVMRCLTLADALRRRGRECVFICRTLVGNLIELIRSKGFMVYPLRNTARHTSLHAPSELSLLSKETNTAHASWLGCSWEQDLDDTLSILEHVEVDTVVVDSYALDKSWEVLIRQRCNFVVVIDDLADRSHDCDLLLDQNYSREKADYDLLVNDTCSRLIGPKFALLREEFPLMRPISLRRRADARIKTILISMGGGDKDNVTSRVLQGLRSCDPNLDFEIKVVLGALALNIESVKRVASSLPWSVSILVNVTNMAELMMESDLAIGAAGGTSWERCCLGLPAITLVLAENQRLISEGLSGKGAAFTCDLNNLELNLGSLINRFFTDPDLLKTMSRKAAGITKGDGVNRVADEIMCL